MNIKRTLAMAKTISRGLWSDKVALLLLFASPVFAIVVFGFGYSGEVSDVRVLVVNQDEGYPIPPSIVRTSISAAIVANLDPEVVGVDRADTEAEAVKVVESGKAYGVIIFPKDFTYNVYQKSLPDGNKSLDTKIRVKLDKTNVAVAGEIRKAVEDALLRTSTTMGAVTAASMDSGDAIYGKGATTKDFFLPGIAAFILEMDLFITTAQAFVGQRISGSLARLQVTPMRPSEFVGGYAIAYTIVGLVQAVAIITLSVYGFRIECVGSMPLAVLVMAVVAVMSLSMGMMLSSLARSAEQALASIGLVALPSALLSGIFWPVEMVPTWLRPLTLVVPTTYGINAARDVMLQGWGIGQIWLELVVLAGFTVAFLALSVFLLGRARG